MGFMMQHGEERGELTVPYPCPQTHACLVFRAFISVYFIYVLLLDSTQYFPNPFDKTSKCPAVAEVVTCIINALYYLTC